MDFGLSEQQEQLRTSVAGFLAVEAQTIHARAVAETGQTDALAMWPRLAQLGWPGLALAEEYGGSGLGLIELAIVLEEMGAVVMPGPFMSATVLGSRAITLLGSGEQRQRLLPELASGARRATLAMVETDGAWQLDGRGSSAKRTEQGWELNCHKLFVPDADGADLVLVAAGMDEGAGLFVVDGVDLELRHMRTVDATRQLYELSCTGLRLGPDRILGGGPFDVARAGALPDGARVALAAELCGHARAALAMSLEHVAVREQFGRPVGSFQAIQHKCADMQVAVENTRSLVYYAAWALDQGLDDASRAAAMAKAYASDHCPAVVEQAVQVHGGMGFTQEHDLHLFLKRAKATETTFGDGAANRERIAGLLGL
ncbi:MAG: acyl-CoA dehydrogenase family protein [Deltaproteobacteria bacterium]